MQWLREYEIRQISRHAKIEMKLDRVEVALASLESRQVAEASQMASGPSAQSLIERGVRDGWEEYINGQ